MCPQLNIVVAHLRKVVPVLRPTYIADIEQNAVYEVRSLQNAGSHIDLPLEFASICMGKHEEIKTTKGVILTVLRLYITRSLSRYIICDESAANNDILLRSGETISP